MKIALITNLYPAYKNQSVQEVSYALHEFTKTWIKKNEVRVIRPYFLPRQYKSLFWKNNMILDKVNIYNCPVIDLQKMAFNKLIKFDKYKFACFHINRILEKENFKPDIVLSHIHDSFEWSYKIAQRLKVPFICGVHECDIRSLHSSIWRRKLDYIFNISDGIACRSHSIYRKVVECYPQFESKCFIAYSGINKKFIGSKSFALTKVHKWKTNKQIRFITVASLIKLKNIDITLKALANLNKDINWKYTIIGDGDQRKYLEMLARKLKINDRVEFKGLRSREYALAEMKKSDIFIMVSAPETFGLVYLEAMAAGNIVIGANNYGIDGIIRDGENGFLCKARDKIHLYNTINNIINTLSLDELETILINAYNSINKLTLENAADNYLEYLRFICDKKSR